MKKLLPSTKIYLAKSAIKDAGRGVFASNNIKKGEIIESCPVIETPIDDYKKIKDTMLRNYDFIWGPKGHHQIAICLGFGSLYNHSYEPNATYSKKVESKLINFQALENIKAGEEITVNYNYGNPKDKNKLWIDDIPVPGTMLKEAKLYTDGGSRGNPGSSAGAFVICNLDNSVVEKSGFYIGVTTNNQAEYQALLHGLQRCVELGVRKLNVFMDSELIVKQLNGVYKIKNKELKPHYLVIKKLQGKFEEISFNHVPRAVNNEADTEVNRILDQQAT